MPQNSCDECNINFDSMDGFLRHILDHTFHRGYKDVSFQASDLDGREGVVTYTVPIDTEISTEANASGAAIVTRWDYNK